MIAQNATRIAARMKTEIGTSIPAIAIRSRPMSSKPLTGMFEPAPRIFVRPRKASSVPRVVMIELTRSVVIANALMTATSSAAPNAAGIATASPTSRASSVKHVAANATADPTDRSTWRATSSSVRGAATIPTTTAFCVTFTRFPGVRKNGLTIENRTTSPTSAVRRATVGVK